MTGEEREREREIRDKGPLILYVPMGCSGGRAKELGT